MAFGSGTINSAGGAVQDIFGGQATGAGLRLRARGNLAEADNYDLAATLARQNAAFTEESTAVKTAQMGRAVYRGIGTAESDIAGAGFAMSGSALDILRDSASQGALTKAILGRQGLITEAGYEEQAQSFTNMSKAARYAAEEQDKMAGTAERNGWITGGIKGAAALASLFTKG